MVYMFYWFGFVFVVFFSPKNQLSDFLISSIIFYFMLDLCIFILFLFTSISTTVMISSEHYFSGTTGLLYGMVFVIFQISFNFYIDFFCDLSCLKESFLKMFKWQGFVIHNFVIDSQFFFYVADYYSCFFGEFFFCGLIYGNFFWKYASIKIILLIMQFWFFYVFI